MSIESGTQVGRYRVTRLIAQGGMAEVYRAEQELTAGIFRPAALKVIRPEYSGSPDFREMFLDEARTACTLSHPNIVHIYEVGEADGLLYMAMELVTGETLAVVSRALREKEERLSDEALLAVGINTCSALEAVHALRLHGEGHHLNLVHRDVSPHNLLLSSSGALKLIDFGIAKAVTNRNLTSPGVTKGKAGYFSPEQAMGRSLDGRSDLFSLGVTLYKLAYGQTPFDMHKTHQARNNALVYGRWEPLSAVCPGLPAGFYDVVNKALMLRPDDRFASAREMREALERVALESGVHVGASSLSGYVQQQESGEVSVTSRTTPSHSLRPVNAPRTPPLAVPPPTSARQRNTEKMVRAHAAPAQRPSRLRMALLGLAGVAAVGFGSGTVMLLGARNQRPAPSAPVTLLPRTLPAPSARRAEPEPVPVAVAGVEPALEAEHEPESDQAPERSAPKRIRPAARAAPASAAKAEPAAIPDGEGQLRIGAEPNGEVSVGGQPWGGTPVSRHVRTGRYTVTITSGRQRGTCDVTVLPDSVARFKYDFAQRKCIPF